MRNVKAMVYRLVVLIDLIAVFVHQNVSDKLIVMKQFMESG